MMCKVIDKIRFNPLCPPAALLASWAEVWTLCEALWGRLGPADEEPDVEARGEYEQQLERRRTFSAWLARGATGRVEEEAALAGKGRHTEAVFSYLTGNRISEACRLAQKEGEETFMLTRVSPLQNQRKSCQTGLWRVQMQRFLEKLVCLNDNLHTCCKKSVTLNQSISEFGP